MQGFAVQQPEHDTRAVDDYTLVPAGCLHTLEDLVNAIAWISRIRESSGIRYRHRVYGIGGTSDGSVGGARALIDLRKLIASGLRGILVPEKVEVARAQDAFDEAGELVAEGPAKLLKALVRNLVDLAGRMAD